MNLSNIIKYSIGRAAMLIWPMHEHRSKGLPVSIDNSSLLLLFSYSCSSELLEIKKLISELQKQNNNVTVVLFSCGIKQISSNFEDALDISVNDFNLIGKPKAELRKWLVENKFDIMLSFIDSNCFFCKKLVHYIDSDFKVGKYSIDMIDQYNLTIVHKSNVLKVQFDQYLHYIQNLNINK